MNKFSAEEKKKIALGAFVVAVVFWGLITAFRGNGFLASGEYAGPKYSTVVGTVSLGQLGLALLLSIGTLTVTVGREILQRLGTLLKPASKPSDVLSGLAADRLSARDKDGYLLVYELQGRCRPPETVAGSPPGAAAPPA